MKRKNSDKRQVSRAKKPKLDNGFPIDTFLQNPGLNHIAEEILACLDIKTLVRCRSVSTSMKLIIDDSPKLLKKVVTDLIKNIKNIEFIELRKEYEDHKREMRRSRMTPSYWRPPYPAIPTYISQQFSALLNSSDWTKNELQMLMKILQCYRSLPSNFLLTGFGRFEFVYKTLVDYALFDKNIDFIKLLANKSDFDFSVSQLKRYSNSTLLHHACIIGTSEIVEYLLEISEEKNIDLNAQDKTAFERTPLDWALIKGDLLIIRSLLSDQRILLGPRCLGMAIATHHDIEIVKLIMKKSEELGIDVDKHRHPPFYVACQSGNLKVAKLLLECPNVSVDTNLIIHINHFDGEEVDFDLTITPLQIACIMGQTEIVKLILQNSSTRNIDLNETCVRGHTPLHYASMFGKHDVVKLLLDHSESHAIKLNIKNNYGRTFDEEAMPTRLMPSSIEKLKKEIATSDFYVLDYRNIFPPMFIS